MNGPNREPNLQGPERMLGGYATGNLSEQEKQELFSAALQDQTLFDALMDEEALKGVLEQPGATRELIDALQPKQSVLTRLCKWLATPMAWGVTGAAATAAVVVVMLATRATEPQAAVQIAKKEAAPVPVAAAREAKPAPAPEAVPAKPLASRMNEARRVALTRKDAGEAKRIVVPESDRKEAQQAGPQTAASDIAQNQAVLDQTVQQQPRAILEQQQQLGQDRQQQLQVQQAPRPVMQAAAPPPAPAKKPAEVRPPIEYVVMKRNEQGEYAAATTFRDADAVRIRVTAHEGGYVALTRRGESKPLVTAQPVQAGQTLVLPASGFLLPSSEPYRLEFARQPLVPGALGVVGGFRAGSVRMKQEELSKSKDASVPEPQVIEILIKGSGN